MQSGKHPLHALSSYIKRDPTVPHTSHASWMNHCMTPEECLTAVTLNAAAALCRADRIGSIEPGKQADILIWDAEDLDYIFYRLGAELVQTVFKAGQRVHG